MSVLTRLRLLPLAPVLFPQARRLRSGTPRMPEASGPREGTVVGVDPLRLLVFGDSTAVGVGARSQQDALAGHLAAEIAERTGRGVLWRVVGESGVTAHGLLARYLSGALETDFDIAFLSVGSNDALKLRSRRMFVRDIRHLLGALRRRCPDALLLMSSLPAFFRFAMMPEPLRRSLYRHSASLEAGARRVVEASAKAHMSPPPPPYSAGFFASDGFHPGPDGYRDWARFAVEDAADPLAGFTSREPGAASRR